MNEPEVSPAVVRCCKCDLSWFAGQLGVLYRSADQRWWCRDEMACRTRQRQREAELAAMQRGLDAAWAALDAAQVAGLNHAFGQMPPMRPGK
ncbi:MAG TPA: hypothetical protein VKH61_06750 [Streptosporangiaceae bacterium]|nr:hypothetical protein [Streptosporangiaceae bacterium]